MTQKRKPAAGDETAAARDVDGDLLTREATSGGTARIVAPRAVLPEPADTADLAEPMCRRRWLVLAFFAPLLVYLALVPRFLAYSSPPTGDQPYYLLMTASLVEDGDLNLRNNYERRDYGKFYERAPRPPGYVGMEAPDPLYPFRARTVRPPDEWYDHRSPGLAVALAPAWTIGSWFGLWWPATIVFMCFVGALVCLNVFLLALSISGRLWAALAVWAPLAFSNPIMSYSYLIFTELPTALLVVYAFRRLALGWGANGRVRLVLIGASIGGIPCLAWRTLPVALALLAYAVVHWVRARRTAPRTLSPAFVLVPVALQAAALGWYNDYLFGSPIVGGSQRAQFQPPLVWPWQGVDELRVFVRHGFGLTFDRQMGLLTHTPLLLFAVVGIIAMLRLGRPCDRRLVAWLGLVTVPYMTVVASFGDWNGVWNPPGRYQTVLVPLAAAPLAFALVAWRDWAVKALYALLALPGLLVMAFRLDDARLLWPAYSVWDRIAGSFGGLDIRGWLPAFSPLEEATFRRDTAFVTALSVGIVILCFLLRDPLWPAGDRAATTLRADVRRYLLAAGTVVVVGLAWYFMLQHVHDGSAS
jgi:hypothetical protein